MAAQPISGHVFRYERKPRPVWRAKYRLPAERAERDQEFASSVIRKAVRAFLRAR